MIMVPGDMIDRHGRRVPEPRRRDADTVPAATGADVLPLHEARDRFEQQYILRALAAQQGNMSRTAEVARRRAQQPLSEDAGVRHRAGTQRPKSRSRNEEQGSGT